MAIVYDMFRTFWCIRWLIFNTVLYILVHFWYWFGYVLAYFSYMLGIVWGIFGTAFGIVGYIFKYIWGEFLVHCWAYVWYLKLFLCYFLGQTLLGIVAFFSIISTNLLALAGSVFVSFWGSFCKENGANNGS